MHGSRFDSFTRRTVGKRETLYNPENSDYPDDDDHGANWDYVLTILGGFGLFILLWTVGMLAWIVGIF